LETAATEFHGTPVPGSLWFAELPKFQKIKAGAELINSPFKKSEQVRAIRAGDFIGEGSDLEIAEKSWVKTISVMGKN
jgi:hypothetical protein